MMHYSDIEDAELTRRWHESGLSAATDSTLALVQQCILSYKPIPITSPKGMSRLMVKEGRFSLYTQLLVAYCRCIRPHEVLQHQINTTAICLSKNENGIAMILLLTSGL